MSLWIDYQAVSLVSGFHLLRDGSLDFDDLAESAPLPAPAYGRVSAR